MQRVEQRDDLVARRGGGQQLLRQEQQLERRTKAEHGHLGVQTALLARDAVDHARDVVEDALELLLEAPPRRDLRGALAEEQRLVEGLGVGLGLGLG